MANEERSNRIKLLRKREERKRLLPILLTNLSLIINRQVYETDVLTIEQIEKHKKLINSSDFDFNFLNISFPINETKELSKLLSVLTHKLSNNNYFAISQFSDIVVLNVPTDFVINNFESIIQFDKDTFTIYDHQYKNGLWIDLFEDYWYLDNEIQFVWIYELRVFGKEWIRLVNQYL